MIKETEVIKIFKTILVEESKAILEKSKNIDSSIFPIIQKILSCPSHSRIITTGVGKSGFIAQKFAATLASTGSLSFFLNPLDALHGDLGMIHDNDIIFGISQSGESEELNKIFKIRGENFKISLTGNKNSTLSKISNFHIHNEIVKEACILNLAPTTSTTLALSLTDAIAVTLMRCKNFSKRDFSLSHPLGSLGTMLTLKVNDISVKDDAFIKDDFSFKNVISSLNKASLGIIVKVDNRNKPLAIFTDGDLKRILLHKNKIDLNEDLSKHFQSDFTFFNENDLAFDVKKKFKLNKINSAPIVDENGCVTGLINYRILSQYGF